MSGMLVAKVVVRSTCGRNSFKTSTWDIKENMKHNTKRREICVHAYNIYIYICNLYTVYGTLYTYVNYVWKIGRAHV